MPLRSLRDLGIAALLLIIAPLAAVAEKIEFTVINNSTQAIQGVYVSLSTASQWGPNLLTSQSLAPGASALVRVGGHCGSYDIKLVADNGIEFLDEETALCANGGTISIGDKGLTNSLPPAPTPCSGDDCHKNDHDHDRHHHDRDRDHHDDDDHHHQKDQQRDDK